jgi:hypothetical protein
VFGVKSYGFFSEVTCAVQWSFGYSGNFPENPDFPEIPEKCPEYPELLDLTASYGDSGVSGDFSGVSGT